ncbi:putative serine/threonine-protein kinase YabT [Weizmannia acidilactici]|uniref:Serine/threonine-protein kinase YabT n=1 Tax=Weizmannia acidilactici TaxID=2607726 RepID=A0A5J4JKZ2_9BACI|nr:protein kinase family protein [Weizmannia acidilactici]GER67629.1 putative serine/threonine-protein kinase YabT [Weizmannia acidilactici]GER71228.1 putative serine/threonine-protein kinase YabT [Weizmannia acidilactici]GER74657.1 putative serine/threonine-protein kinase YabT [Weizmannia acidilactici]
MMTNDTLKSRSNYPSGTVITGKWHKKQYRIRKKLGVGANGAVYLAESEAGPVALKIGASTASMASEANVLKSFAKAQGHSLGPSLLDADDWEPGAEPIPFYAMEYIHGPDLLSFVSEKGFAWAGVLVVQLLSDVHHLHEQGWIFGDLKPENLLVEVPSNRIRCIDPGGMTKIGRSVKEFTEFFDRGYWGLGPRKADPGYDLFSVAMVMINLAYQRRFTKKNNNGLLQLMAAVKQHPGLKKFEPVLRKALRGTYRSASEMRRELLGLLTQEKTADKRGYSGKGEPQKQKVRMSRVKKRKFRKLKKIFAGIAIIVIVSMLYWIYSFYIV